MSTFYHVFILRKVYIKLRNAYIITCSPTGKLIKAAARLYYHVFICRNVNIYICGLHISLGVHRRESWYKVSVCIYYHVFVCKKVDIKLRYVYIIRCSSAGKLISSCGMYISSGVHLQESWYKVAVCIYHHVFIWGKVNI